MHSPKRHAGETFAECWYTPQGIEESLASSVCAISAINSWTDDSGRQLRDRPGFGGVTTQVDGIGGRKSALPSARIASNQSGSRRGFCAISRTECVVPLVRMKSSAVE